MPLGDYLGADQNIDLKVVHGLEHGQVIATIAAGIPVKAGHPGRGHYPAQFGLQPFGAEPHPDQLAPLAGWTGVGNRPDMAAIMTEQLAAALMHGHGHLAMSTGNALAAGAAEHQVGIAAAVQKEQALLAPGEILFQGTYQVR